MPTIIRLYILASLLFAPWWAWAQDAEVPSDPETDPATWDGGE